MSGAGNGVGRGNAVRQNHRDIAELRVISSSADMNGSLFTDAIVQKNCSVHVWGSVSGHLTIEPGADVLIDGSVCGKINNRGGRLVVNHKGLTAVFMSGKAHRN